MFLKIAHGHAHGRSHDRDREPVGFSAQYPSEHDAAHVRRGEVFMKH